ncbi:HFR053Cp [Eremothecium sinecaudum]|uniref:HFR053Cp n=1 Tax=Eremothecium sinecaudum TaxID=45286 RepID=A0A0X8HV07_9SACH|nr:HFR053Cp [Eremothecium sinecaudum]AMD21908.1 HFR053Cp [Eremothecium sinecaudum]
MVSNFSKCSGHRKYTLALYRYTLRNLNYYYPYSSVVRSEVKKVLLLQTKQHQNNISSWSVYKRLNDLKLMNEYLEASDTSKISQLLQKYCAKKRLQNDEHLDVSPAQPIKRKSKDDKPKFKSYVALLQRQLELPAYIPKHYLTTLVQPWALHHKYKKKMLNIKALMEKGPPKVYMSYTSVGPAKFWFLRSMMIKGRRQPKSVGVYIRNLKHDGQKNLNQYYKCVEDVQWAWHEAIWEHYLLTGEILSGNPMSLTKNMMPDELRSQSTDKDSKKNDDLKFPPSAKEWFEPFIISIRFLADKSNKVVKTLQRKHNEVKQGPYNYYKKKTFNVHKQKLRRFAKMEEELSNVNPYTSSNNLKSILLRWKIISPE